MQKNNRKQLSQTVNFFDFLKIDQNGVSLLSMIRAEEELKTLISNTSLHFQGSDPNLQLYGQELKMEETLRY